MIKIRDYRLRKGLTMKELGQIVGVTESAVGMWENGRRKPNYEYLLRISEALDCTVADLIDEREAPAPLPETETEGDVYPEITMIARAGAKMTPEKRADMLKILRTIYPEEFE